MQHAGSPPLRQFAHYLLNSVIVAICATAVALLLGVPAGYAFAHSPIRGARIFNTWFVLAYVAPPVVFIIPLYIMYQHLHLLDTYQGLILAYETGLLVGLAWGEYFGALILTGPHTETAPVARPCCPLSATGRSIPRKQPVTQKGCWPTGRTDSAWRAAPVSSSP